MPPIIACWEYFPKRKGLVSAIILAGFVLSSFVWGILAWLIVNPSNLMIRNLFLGNYPPTDYIPGGLIFRSNSSVTQRAPLMLRLLWALYFALFAISLFLIRPLEKK